VFILTGETAGSQERFGTTSSLPWMEGSCVTA